jgi:hypothetical protein
LPIRKENPLARYNIEVTQATVSDVIFETRFNEMIAQQRDSAAQASVERQKANTLDLERLRAIAQGEKEKAVVRAEEEKKQIVRLTQIETRRKEEQQKLEIEKLLLAQAEQEALRIRELAEAEAYQRKSLMEADNALQARLNAMIEINKAYAEALVNKQLVPNVVVGAKDGETSSATDLIDMIMVGVAQQLNNATKSE